MQMQLNGMTLTGTPNELATFVKQYENKTWQPVYPPNKTPWYWNGGTWTGMNGITTGVDAMTNYPKYTYETGDGADIRMK